MAMFHRALGLLRPHIACTLPLKPVGAVGAATKRHGLRDPLRCASAAATVPRAPTVDQPAVAEAMGTTGCSHPAPDDDGWFTRVGLEVHAQIRSNTKAFSGSRVAFAEEPNTQVGREHLTHVAHTVVHPCCLFIYCKHLPVTHHHRVDLPALRFPTLGPACPAMFILLWPACLL